MFLIPKLIKKSKSQEDVAAIQDYMSQLHDFHAPYEILKELCYNMNYKFVKQGDTIKQCSNYAYFIIKGEILSDNGQRYTDEHWYDLDYQFYAIIDTHFIVITIDKYKNFNHTHGTNFQFRKNMLMQNIPSIDKINSSKIQEKFIRSFIEITYTIGSLIFKEQESADHLYVLTSGTLQISRNYQKKMTPFEKQVLPKKYQSTEINICQITDTGIIGEELLTQSNSLYTIKVLSKTAILQQASIYQLKCFQNIPEVIQQIQCSFNNKLFQREEIYQQKCEEMENTWQQKNKQMIINSEIKKSISLKFVKDKSNNQTFQNKKNKNQQMENIQEFQRGQSPIKKTPTFIQQYFKQKQIESHQKNTQITLQEFIQKQKHCSNPYQLFEKVHDPLNYIQKGQNYKRQQFAVLIQHGIVKLKNPQIPRVPKRPLTSYGGNVDETTEINQPRMIIKSVHTPKPMANTVKKYYRSQSAHKTNGFSLVGKSISSSSRDNLFYLRSNSTNTFKLTLSKSQHNINQSNNCYTDKKIQCEESII